MGRNCVICANQMASFVRQKSLEYPTQPSAIINEVLVKYGVRITRAMLRNHSKLHDPLAGTITSARRTIGKKQAQLEEVLSSGQQIIGQLEGLLVRGTELDGLNWKEFQSMPLSKQVKLQIELHKLALMVKDLEMKQERMNKSKDARLGLMNQMAANTFKSTKVPNAQSAA